MNQHRRELKRQYLETPTRAGVYAIRNLVNGRLLVAGSNDAQAALNRHRFELKLGAHADALLRQDWAEHGEPGFVFEVVDRVKPRDDPAFDAAQELAALVELWRQELSCAQAPGYGAPGGQP